MQVNVPIQFICGDGDEICTRACVDDIKNLVPLARYVHFSECGHFPFLTRPQEFNRILEDFLVC